MSAGHPPQAMDRMILKDCVVTNDRLGGVMDLWFIFANRLQEPPKFLIFDRAPVAPAIIVHINPEVQCELTAMLTRCELNDLMVVVSNRAKCAKGQFDRSFICWGAVLAGHEVRPQGKVQRRAVWAECNAL